MEIRLLSINVSLLKTIDEEYDLLIHPDCNIDFLYCLEGMINVISNEVVDMTIEEYNNLTTGTYGDDTMQVKVLKMSIDNLENGYYKLTRFDTADEALQFVNNCNSLYSKELYVTDLTRFERLKRTTKDHGIEVSSCKWGVYHNLSSEQVSAAIYLASEKEIEYNRLNSMLTNYFDVRRYTDSLHSLIKKQKVFKKGNHIDMMDKFNLSHQQLLELKQVFNKNEFTNN